MSEPTSISARRARSRGGRRFGLPRPGRRWLAAAATLGAALAATGCVTQATAYPIETFTEMHYSQAYRSQETPRLSGVQGAVPFTEAGVNDALTMLPARDRRAYVPERAAELFRVNCSVCHGPAGLGDGAAVPYITSRQSAWAVDNGAPYVAPPNLQESRTRLDEPTVFGIVTGGITLMPRFGPLLSEEDRWDIVKYVFDTETGLGR